MSVRIYNAPDVTRANMVDTFRISSPSRDRSFDPEYSYVRQSYMGSDLLQLSDNYSSDSSSYSSSSYSNYSNLLRLLFITFAIFTIIAISLSALVIMGGIVSVIVFALIVLSSVFLYSLNLNPFDRKTYKKISRYLK
ncbi:MAG: hypothetical protein H7263_15400 [Candidatus Sericytochromatia bacterium]|nr:hypothetical protein [Candidatus Sericytochromatia bacterium]